MTSFTQEKSPKSKGSRLTRLRLMADMTRREIVDNLELNLNTYNGWEIGRHGGITPKEAYKLVKLFNDSGVCCNFEWLMYCIGSGPCFNDELNTIKPKFCNDFFSDNENRKIFDKIVKEELGVFEKNYGLDTLCFFVKNNSMYPYYEEGDLVAGVQIPKLHIEKIIPSIFIVQLETGEFVLRYVKQGSEDGLYDLFFTNFKNEKSTQLIDKKIYSAAKTTWIRKV